MSTQSKFTFIGTPLINKEPEKFYKKWNGREDGTANSSLSFAVEEDRMNRAFVQLFGMKRKVLKTMSTENRMIEVDWNDRNKPEVVQSIANYRKRTVDLGSDFGGRHMFTNEWDMNEFLAASLPDYPGKIRVDGNWTKNEYNGKMYDRFTISNVYAVKADETPVLRLTMDYYYNTDCVDQGSLKTEGKIYVNGYMEQYIDRDTGYAFIPQIAVLNQHDYNLTNEKNATVWNYELSYLTSELPKKNKFGHIRWECHLHNGPEEVSFDESMLTDRQKEQVKLGLRTVDDFRPTSKIYGPKSSEVRLSNPILKGECADGIVECDMTNEEFESKIYKIAATEKLDDVIAIANDDDDDDLF